MKIWKLVDKRILKKLVEVNSLWILVNDKGELKKVGSLKEVRKLMVENDVRFKIERKV